MPTPPHLPSLRRTLPAIAVTIGAILAAVGRASAAAPILPPFLAERCLGCHGGDDAAGGPDLSPAASEARAAARPRLFAAVIDAVDSGAMPPDGEPPLEPDLRERSLRWLRDRLAESARASSPPPPPLHRLNRFHYNATIRDLFRLDRDLFALPEKLIARDDPRLVAVAPATPGRLPDLIHAAARSLSPAPVLEGLKPFPKDLRAEHGFDNQADELTLSPLLLESFLRLAHSIVESPDFNPATVGIWDEFFAAPPADHDRPAELRRRLEPFLRRAFRGRIDAEIVDRYVAFAIARLDDGQPYPEAMKRTAAAALSSPLFLYRHPATGPGDAPLALASRLAAFLWSSAPDDSLLDEAEAGAILHPDVLDRTVRRMLADPRIERFLDSFPTQWMQLENALSATPDPELAPDFHRFRGTPASLQLVVEPLLLFDAVFVEDRPLIELIAPSSHYRSDFLDDWYRGGPSVAAGAPPSDDETLRRRLLSREFRRVPCDDPRFGGIVTNAAVASMTSGPKRTHPVARGVWVAEVIFNAPPEPPPADVPPLADEPDDPSQTIRERFAAHRANASCAGCHSRLDPLGFALENYDVGGRWRDRYPNDRPVDAAGVLLARHPFADAVGFKAAVVMERERFARAFTSHLMRFALGRELVVADRLEVESIVARSAERGHAIRDLIRGVVQADAFRDLGQISGRDAD